MAWHEMVQDGKKWIAVAMVVTAAILYLAITKSYRDCVDTYLENATHEEAERIAVMTCHLKRG